jgi:hypothetical protein
MISYHFPREHETIHIDDNDPRQVGLVAIGTAWSQVEHPGWHVGPLCAVLQVHALPMLPELGIASQRAADEMTSDDAEAIAAWSWSGYRAMLAEFGWIENGQRVYA